MNIRLKILRKTLNLTQAGFGAKISVKGNTVSQWESGRNEPSDSSIKFICQIFNVNEEWLKNGTGEMFSKLPYSTLDRLTEEYHLDSASCVAIEKFAKLSPELRDGIISYFSDVIDTIRR